MFVGELQGILDGHDVDTRPSSARSGRPRSFGPKRGIDICRRDDDSTCCRVWFYGSRSLEECLRARCLREGVARSLLMVNVPALDHEISQTTVGVQHQVVQDDKPEQE